MIMDLLIAYSDYVVWILGLLVMTITAIVARISGKIRKLEDWRIGQAPYCESHNKVLTSISDSLIKIQQDIATVNVNLSQRLSYLEGKEGK